MDSEWLQKTLRSFSDEIEQCVAGWQQAGLVYEDSEEVWLDSAALKFRQCYWDEMDQESLALINGLQGKNETLDKALLSIIEAESQRKKLFMQFEIFVKACEDEGELVSLLKRNIINAEDEVELSQQKMNDVDAILRQIIE